MIERLDRTTLRRIYFQHADGGYGVCFSGCVRADSDESPNMPCDARIAAAIALGLSVTPPSVARVIDRGSSVALHEVEERL